MKTFLKASTLFVLIAATVSHSYVEEQDTIPRKWDVGLAAGKIGGSGISVRRWLDPKNSIQLNFVPFYTEEKYPADSDDDYYSNHRDSGYANTGFLSVGALYLHRLGEYNGLFLSSFGGASYTARFEKSDFYTSSNYYGNNVEHHVRNSVKGTAALGGGFGGGFEFWRIDISLLLGIAGAYDLAKETKSLTPSADLSIHFHL